MIAHEHHLGIRRLQSGGREFQHDHRSGGKLITHQRRLECGFDGARHPFWRRQAPPQDGVLAQGFRRWQRA